MSATSRPGLRGAPLFVLLATVLGGWLRGSGLEDFALTHWDEGLAWRGARYFWSFGAEGHYSPTAAPPLVPLLFAIGTRLLGQALTSAVAVNVLFSTLAIPLAYLLARELAGVRAGALAAFLLAGSGLHVMYARSLLTESVYVFFLLAVLYGSARYLKARQVRWLVATGLFAVCLQYAKYNGFLGTVPLGLVLVADFVRDPGEKGLAKTLRSCCLLGLPVVLAIALNLVAIAQIADLDYFIDHFTQYVGTQTPSIIEMAGLLTSVVPLSVCVFALVGAVALSRPLRREMVLLHVAFALYFLFAFNYRFYLRLLAPVATLLVVYAALFVDRIFELRARSLALSLGSLLLALVAWEGWASFDRFYLTRFDAYRRVAAYVNELPESLPVLFVSQDNVWDDLDRPAEVHMLPSERADRVLERGPEVLLVCDLWFFTRLSPWDLSKVFDHLSERYRVARFDNTVSLEAWPPEALRRLVSDSALRERVLSIHVMRMPSEALRSAVAELAVLRE